MSWCSVVPSRNPRREISFWMHSRALRSSGPVGTRHPRSTPRRRQSLSRAVFLLSFPSVGTSAVAAQGYVDCAREIEQQLAGLDRVVVALGSGGTMAGLVAHLGVDRVVGVDVGAVADPVSTVAGLLDEMPGPTVRAADLQILRNQVGQGYSTLTDASAGAIRCLARTEGIFLDPTYTGRAFAGLIQLVKDKAITAGSKTVFLHTGGLPGLFGHPELSTLR